MITETDLYLFDGVFANCDAYVTKKMFHSGIMHHLKHKTRIIILSSHLQLLPFFDEIWLMDNGRIILHRQP